MGKLFGTDGIRGIANADLNPDLVYRLGKVSGYLILKSSGNRPRVLVAKDTRASGDLLEAALTAGMCAVGVNVSRLGIMTTAGVAYLVGKLNANAGVVISASHNPAEYNGIKFFGPDGYKLPDEFELEVESYLDAPQDSIPLALGTSVGTVTDDSSAQQCYIDFVRRTAGCKLSGLKVVIDPANGAASRIAPQIFEELGAKVRVINADPDGGNINASCGAVDTSLLRHEVLNWGADVGLAMDGDADRLIAIDEKGEVVNGDHVLTICALGLKSRGELSGNAIVTTIMANIGLDVTLQRAGIQVHRTKVGDKYVLEEMRKRGLVLGGEQSGHIIFLKHTTTGDGLVTGVQLLCEMLIAGKRLSELRNLMSSFPQCTINVSFDKAEYERVISQLYKIESLVSRIRERLQPGQVLVRPSGTEPVVRIMTQGLDELEVRMAAEELGEAVRQIKNGG